MEKWDKPMRKRWIKRFAVVALATAVSVYTVPKTGLLAALGLSQTTEAEESSSDQKGPDGGPGGQGQPGGGPGEASSGVSDYSAVNKLTSDAVLDGQTITSTGTDENAVNVSEGANVTVKNSTVSRESSDSTGGDNSSFYGVGSALLCTNGVLNVVKDTITTNAAGGAGVFAYGDGTANVADTTITTSQDTSGGIHVAGGGTLHAWNVTAETSGQSSAAIRSDRGGGTMVFVLVVIFSRLVFRPIAESYQKQKQFITDASREIKTPLTIIDANVEVIEMMSGENKWTKSTKNQVKRLASLAGQLITLSKMDEGDGAADKMKFSMTDAVIDTTSSFESVAETKGRKLVCDIEENLYFVGEEKRIREMFGIFLDNAVKYSTEGSEIHVSLERKGRKIIYQISNETDLIEKGNQDVLFERFYRSDASRNSATGGSGIGLSVAKAVAEAHHGKLTAESKDGKSLTITLTLGAVANKP